MTQRAFAEAFNYRKWNEDQNVGASLLAKAVGQSAILQRLTTPSRASSLPQVFVYAVISCVARRTGRTHR
ncbi:hypothetical protein E1508_23145 [Pseudomonas moraviensis]|nr:hypothetical protein E1508_23145 [Pseudomonas moraviensis]